MGLIQSIKNAFQKNPSPRFEMITQRTGNFFGFRGKLYESDVIRAAIRPKARAIGKALAQHVEKDQKTGNTRINGQPGMRFLLEEPNAYMTGQMLQEKLAVQLELNNNAFAFIERDGTTPVAIYPVDCSAFEMQTDDSGELYLRFTMYDGRLWVAKYSNVIHLRKDYGPNVFLGETHGEALTNLMEVISISDQGIVSAIKNSTVIRWLLKFHSTLKPDDLQKRAKEFASAYTATESETGGVAAVGADAEAVQVDSKEYVPNALQSANTVKRVYAYFNTNESIVQSSYTEDQWISYYEACIEPDIMQMSNEFTRKLFTRKERSYGNRIVFTSSNLTFASMATKLQLVQMVDRAIMSPNEVREILGYAPVEGGDEMIRRLDTRPTKEDANGN